MEFVFTHPFLIAAEEYKEIDRVVSTRFDAALGYAHALNFKALHKMLAPFINNKFSSRRAAGIYKLYYLEQMDRYGPKLQEKHWKTAFRNYTVRFGLDNEIEVLARKYDREKLLEEMPEVEEPDFHGYQIVSNIVTEPLTPVKKAAPEKG